MQQYQIYTTQADVKEGNRNLETLLRDLEYLATLASLKTASSSGSSYLYPKNELDEMWQDLLLGQFHDCLPGTTIKMVVQDNIDIYQRRGQQAEGLIKKALEVLAGVNGGKEENSEQSTHVIDPLRLERDEIVSTRVSGGEGYGRLLTDNNGIGSIDSSPSNLSPPSAKQISNGAGYTLENAYFSLTISNGRISSILDKRQSRELITPGPRSEDGGWVIFEDYPLRYDAWDVEIYHLKTARNIRFDHGQEGDVKVENDPKGLRSSLVVTAKFGKSFATLKVSWDLNFGLWTLGFGLCSFALRFCSACLLGSYSWLSRNTNGSKAQSAVQLGC